MAVEVREIIQRFAEQMELKLRANDHKAGWHGELVSGLLLELEDEVTELNLAALNDGTPEAITSEAADVALYAMFIADVNGGIPHQDEVPVDERGRASHSHAFCP